MNRLVIHNLHKSYSNKKVLDALSLSLANEEILGLIGPNGSGKTTLLNILMGLILPNEGSFSFSENTKVSMSVSRKGFFDDMTVVNNIGLILEVSGLTQNSEIQDLTETLGIDFEHQHYGNLSAGQRQKVSLLLAFAGSHNLVLLDEPSNHLDVDALIALRNLIVEKKKRGASLLITSHVLSDLEKVCDRIAFIKKGTLLHDDSKENLMREYGSLEKAYLDILK
jgi:ABC-2 type transport system ATP-binding protein